MKDRLSNEVKAEVFDGVMVCTGHHAHENIPVLPGSEVFKVIPHQILFLSYLCFNRN